MAAKYIADLTEKPALVEADAILVGDSAVTGAGSGKKHLPKQSATASSVALRTTGGQLKAADGVEDDDLVTVQQNAAESSKVVRLSRALAKDTDVGDTASIFADFKSQGFGLGITDGIDEAKTDLELFNNFSRTSSGWRFNSRGQLEEVAAGIPRYNYNPATGEAEGLLIEEQRTNIVPFSISPSNWENFTYDLSSQGELLGLPVTRITNNGTHVGSLSTSGNNSIRPLITVPSAGTYTDSVIVKRVNTPSVTFGRYGNGADMARFDFDTESFVHTHGRATNLRAIKLSDDFWYLQATAEAGDTLSRFLIAPSNAGGVGEVGSVAEGDAVDVLFAQREAGLFATSPIITNGTAVTRTSDSVARTLGAEFNPNEGTFVVEFNTNFATSITQVPFILSLIGATAGDRFSLTLNSNTGGCYITARSGGVVIGSTSSSAPEIPAVTPLQRVKASVSFGEAGIKLSVNGSPVVSAVLSQPLPTFTSAWIGDPLSVGGSAKYLDGTVSLLKYEPHAVSDAQLQELSTL